MPLSLIPSRLFQRYQEVTPALLRGAGVTLLLSDLDFTLAPKSVRRPDPALRAWIAEMKAAGIQVAPGSRSSARTWAFPTRAAPGSPPPGG